MVNYAQILQLAPGTPAFYWGRESFELGLTAGMLTICNQESYLVDTPVSSLNLQGFYDRLDPLGFFQS
jgi:hypothetical protein